MTRPNQPLLISFCFQILTLNRFALDETISGNTINLVSNDAQAIEQSGHPVFLCSFALLDIIVSLVLVWYLVAWQALIGAGLILIVSAYGSVAAHKAGMIRKKVAAQTDKRLEIMREVIAGIRVVKMYAWEWNFRDLVAEIRRFEPTVLYCMLSMIHTIAVEESDVKGTS